MGSEEMINLFVGKDPKEACGLPVFCHSVWARSSMPVSITPISGPTDGTNAFTLARFKVPEMMGFRGHAIWADGSDMLCLADIAELWSLRDNFKAVQVVKHAYKTKFPVKYLGQRNDDYYRKNWSSLMLINCGHYAWQHINGKSPKELHRFEWINDLHIGTLPKEWNHLVHEENQSDTVKLCHFTVGLPVWGQYANWQYADEWRKEREAMLSFQEWK